MRVGIVGSRNFRNYKLFKKFLKEWIIENGEIESLVSGGATGADKLTERYSDEKEIPITIYNANWKVYGKSAGPRRNTFIVEDCDFVIAFPSESSRGTWDTVNKAKKRDIPVKLVYV